MKPPTKRQVILMPHSKLPWKERIDNPILNENPIPMPEYVIYGEGGERLVASVWTKTKLGDEEAKANANLIITAVNVMPEVRDLLCRLSGYSDGILDQFQNRSGHLDVTGLKSYIKEIGNLLEKLEGVDV